SLWGHGRGPGGNSPGPLLSPPPELFAPDYGPSVGVGVQTCRHPLGVFVIVGVMVAVLVAAPGVFVLVGADGVFVFVGVLVAVPVAVAGSGVNVVVAVKVAPIPGVGVGQVFWRPGTHRVGVAVAGVPVGVAVAVREATGVRVGAVALCRNASYAPASGSWILALCG